MLKSLQTAEQKASRYLSVFANSSFINEGTISSFISLYQRVESDPSKKKAVIHEFDRYVRDAALDNNMKSLRGPMLIAEAIPTLRDAFDVGVVGRMAQDALYRSEDHIKSCGSDARKMADNSHIHSFIEIYVFSRGHTQHYAAVTPDMVKKMADMSLPNRLDKFLELANIVKQAPEHYSAISPKMIDTALDISLEQGHAWADVFRRNFKKLKEFESVIQPAEKIFSPEVIGKKAEKLLADRKLDQFIMLREAVAGDAALERGFSAQSIEKAIAIGNNDNYSRNRYAYYLRLAVGNVPEQAAVFGQESIANAMDYAVKGKHIPSIVSLYKVLQEYPEHLNAITPEMIKDAATIMLKDPQDKSIVAFSRMTEAHAAHHEAFQQAAYVKTVPVTGATDRDPDHIHIVFNVGAGQASYVDGSSRYNSLSSLMSEWDKAGVTPPTTDIINGLWGVLGSDSRAADVARTELALLTSTRGRTVGPA